MDLIESVIMSDVTHLLEAAAAGDRRASGNLLPLVYEELRKLAATKMANERPDHTLDATALVHEAYLRLVGGMNRLTWEHRHQFFAAAAEAMRRVLIDHARSAQARKRGGDRDRIEIDQIADPDATSAIDWLVIDDSLAKLAAEDATAAELVRLKLFAGLTVDEAAEVLGVSRATAYRDWTFARAWLREATGIGTKNSSFF
jgi:RNA polymerase sigma factor (TIGR02999 family)